MIFVVAVVGHNLRIVRGVACVIVIIVLIDVERILLQLDIDCVGEMLPCALPMLLSKESRESLQKAPSKSQPQEQEIVWVVIVNAAVDAFALFAVAGYCYCWQKTASSPAGRGPLLLFPLSYPCRRGASISIRPRVPLLLM